MPVPCVASGVVRIGSQDIVMMVGPCTVESEQQLMTMAKVVRHAGPFCYAEVLLNPQPPLMAFVAWVNHDQLGCWRSKYPGLDAPSFLVFQLVLMGPNSYRPHSFCNGRRGRNE